MTVSKFIDASLKVVVVLLLVDAFVMDKHLNMFKCAPMKCRNALIL